MQQNQLYKVFLICLMLIAGLFYFSVFPEFELGSFRYKKIDPLADIRVVAPDTTQEVITVLDSADTRIDSVARAVERRCPAGLTCIEDYSSDSTALQSFIEALTLLREKKSTLRVAFYGDSFIEGDVFCGGFRDTLQSIFGGRGVGFVPITSTVAGFRPTIKHSFDGWQTHSLIQKTDSAVVLGPAGYAFIPLEENYVTYEASKQRFLRSFNTVDLFYRSPSANEVNLLVDEDTTVTADVLEPERQIGRWRKTLQESKKVTLSFPGADSLWLYGASFEGEPGIYVDNFSLRGNSGMALGALSSSVLKKFNSYRDYKLIILQFGLNSVVEDSLNYSAYAKRMIKVINKLKKDYASASILLLSVSDRSTNRNGEYETMRAIPAMRNAQRLIAKETHVAFWDLFEAMGGENSMVTFSESKPPLAAKDYTHLTFAGGKKLAGLLTRSLLHAGEVAEKRKLKDKNQ